MGEMGRNGRSMAREGEDEHTAPRHVYAACLFLLWGGGCAFFLFFMFLSFGFIFFRAFWCVRDGVTAVCRRKTKVRLDRYLLDYSMPLIILSFSVEGRPVN